MTKVGEMASASLPLERYYTERGPKILTLESTSVCNLRCVMCPHAVGKVARPKHLPVDVVEKLRGALSTVETVQLHGIGEPLFSPAFWRTLDRLSDSTAEFVSFNSNFTILKDEQIEGLLKSRLHMVNVSLDAATPETYAKIRGYDFDKVIDNLRRFLAQRDNLGLKIPKVYINMTLMLANIDEASAFVRMGHELGVDKVCFWHLNSGSDYSIDRDGWTFDYKDQMLVEHPALSNRRIREALTQAKALGMAVYLDANKEVYFEEPVE